MANRKRSRKVRAKEPAKLRRISPSKQLDALIYWTTLLVLTLANLFAAIAITPFMFIAPSLPFYILVSFIALFFGFIFSMLVTRLENIDRHHHILAAFFIPSLALFNLIVLAHSTARFAEILGIKTTKDLLLTGFVYIVFFMIPHSVHIAKKWRKA